MTLRDEHDGWGPRAATMLANWDGLLDTKSPQIWGVSTNDWFGAFRELQPTSESLRALTDRNLDRGELEVLVAEYDLPS